MRWAKRQHLRRNTLGSWDWRAPYETTLRRRLDSACQYVPDESLANLHPLNPEGRSHPYTNPTNWFRGVRTKKAGAIRTARLAKGAQLTTEAVAQ